jgi:hypothetical protein
MTVAFEIKHGFGCKIHEKKIITYKEVKTKKKQGEEVTSPSLAWN